MKNEKFVEMRKDENPLSFFEKIFCEKKRKELFFVFEIFNEIKRRKTNRILMKIKLKIEFSERKTFVEIDFDFEKKIEKRKMFVFLFKMPIVMIQ